MSTLRALLEEIARLDDARRKAGKSAPGGGMTLYPPASRAAIDRLLKGGWSHPLPRSFGEFLAATDGISKFRGRLDFLGTDAGRQEPIRSVIEEQIDQDKIDLRAMYKVVDDAVIHKWESDAARFYVANHPVIAVTEMGGLLFYDSRTRDAKGEMQLCWRSPGQATVENRYDDILKYFENALEEVRR